MTATARAQSSMLDDLTKARHYIRRQWLLRCHLALGMAAALLTAPTGWADGGAGEKANETLPTVAESVADLDAKGGFLRLHMDQQKGKIFLEVPAPDAAGKALELIYLEGLTSGLGSNPVGLDRGQMGDAKLLELRRVGEKVLFLEPNLKFRALSESETESRAVRQSFAPSVIWGADLVALDGDGRSLIDLTPFLVRDAHGVVATLKETKQGVFALDSKRSAVDFSACLAFPDNVELEAFLTYASEAPGELVEDTVPTKETFTLVQHHSFVRLPPPGYRTRDFDPRMPSYGVKFQDYAVGLEEPIEKAFINRHRLEKVNPGVERSAVREPIVYYVDPGAPEPVRSALLDGARWWAEAFEAAGFEDAYRVELLPAGAHPLDVRYNVIQWVHRSTRGWSYGHALSDPRTGEILKGHVSLGSLRVRQDILLFEGMAGVEKTGSGAADDPVQLALARIRQLAAHEVGHTLGFTHNFAASTYADRASVMDYPAPLVQVNAATGELDFSRAYGVGIGAWDAHSVRFAYSELAPGTTEKAALEAIVQEGLARGLLFLADDDARPAGAADPRANLWDNGAEPVAALEETLAVRLLALNRFGAGNLAPGRPLAHLQEVLAPLYFHHRYQLEAAAKVIGGLEYSYSLRGDGQTPSRPVSGERQRKALEVILGILAPEELDVPDQVLELLLPRPFDSESNREMFASGTAPAFDPLGAAATAASSLAGHLLVPERLARVRDHSRRDPTMLSLEELLGGLVARSFPLEPRMEGRLAEVRRTTARAVAEAILLRAADPKLDPELGAWLEWSLRQILLRLESPVAELTLTEGVHRRALTARLERFLDREYRAGAMPWKPAEPPPGSPIGMDHYPVDPRLGCSVGL